MRRTANTHARQPGAVASSILAAALVFVAAASCPTRSHGETEPFYQPPPVEPAKPTATPPPAAEPTKPLVILADLPEPALGLEFNDPRIVDAAKLAEHGDFDGATKLLKEAMKAEKGPDRAKVEELRVGLGMIYIRSGDATNTKNVIRSLADRESDDAGVRQTESVSHRARVLEAVTKYGPKANRLKGEPSPLQGPGEWLAALKEVAPKLMDEHDEQVTQMRRFASKRAWSNVQTRLRTTRELIEQLDCIRSLADPEVWSAAATKHSDEIEATVQKMNTHAAELKGFIDTDKKNMFVSELGNGYYPKKVVDHYNGCRAELIQLRDLGREYALHYERAGSKWGGGGNFNRRVWIDISQEDIPEKRTPALIFKRR